MTGTSLPDIVLSFSEQFFALRINKRKYTFSALCVLPLVCFQLLTVLFRMLASLFLPHFLVP